MPRPEKPIDSSAGPVQAFAAELRAARHRAGLTYKQMARRGSVSQSTLSKAASGEEPPPTWGAVEAYLRSLGLTNELPFWRDRWTTMRTGHAVLAGRTWQEPEEPRQPPPAAPATAATPDHAPRNTGTPAPPRRRRRPAVAAGVVLLVVLAAAAIVIASGAFRPEITERASTTRSPATGQASAGRSAATVTVQNMIATGLNNLIEDSTPAYLSTRPVPFCARNGCKVAGTEMWSGTTLTVTCSVQGRAMANYNTDAPESVHNPHSVTSALWYRGAMSGYRVGYLSEIYVFPQYRGGLGLPGCDPPPTASAPVGSGA